MGFQTGEKLPLELLYIVGSANNDLALTFSPERAREIVAAILCVLRIELRQLQQRGALTTQTTHLLAHALDLYTNPMHIAHQPFEPPLAQHQEREDHPQ